MDFIVKKKKSSILNTLKHGKLPEQLSVRVFLMHAYHCAAVILEKVRYLLCNLEIF